MLLVLNRKTGDDALTVPGVTEQERELILECAKSQLKWLRDSQGLFLKARQLVISQKHHLYKYDELEMCIARCAPVICILSSQPQCLVHA